jgi:hypothetical protein
MRTDVPRPCTQTARNGASGPIARLSVQLTTACAEFDGVFRVRRRAQSSMACADFNAGV